MAEFKKVVRWIKTKKTVSRNELQIQFKKGYCWAYRMISKLEESDLISLNDIYGNYDVLTKEDY